MAWTSPHSWSVSEEVTAALLNTYQRDNLQYLYDRLALLTGTVTGVGHLSVTLTVGTWLLFATFQRADAGTCQIDKAGVNQIQISIGEMGAPSIVYSTVVPSGTQVWTASGGAITFNALRVVL